MAEQTILLLGIEGSGKTTYLYRLVTSYLESKGLSRTEIDELDAESFLNEARRHGVTWEPNSATEAFLGQAHEAMRDDRDIKLDVSEEAVPLAIGFTEYDYWIKTAEVPGSLVTRTAHLLERGEIENGDEAVQAYYAYLRRLLRKADGVLFMHPPHELGREVESEIVLRALGSLALRMSKSQFMPVVIVFTKAEHWAPPTPSAQTRAVALASNPSVMAKRDRFIEAYWQVLMTHHGSELDHPFWRGVTDPYRTGQNFAMIAANKDRFADLRAPLDAVARLNSLKGGFYRNLRRRNVTLATVGLFVFALGILLALYLPALFHSHEEALVPDFPNAQSVYAWLQDGPSGAELEAALRQIDSRLYATEQRLRGATGAFVLPAFNEYRAFLATISGVRDRARLLGNDGAAAMAEASKVEHRVLDVLEEWLEQHEGAAESPEEFDFRWIAAAERYVDGLAVYLRHADPSRYDEWRSAWLTKQFHDVRQSLEETREQRPTGEGYVEAARRQLDLAWRHLVDGQTPHGESLTYLPLRRDEERYQTLQEARRFITRLHENSLEIELHVEHYANTWDFHDDLHDELRLEVGSVRMALVADETASTDDKRVYVPQRDEPLRFRWNIHRSPTLRIKDPRPGLGDDFDLFEVAVENCVSDLEREMLPLPEFFPAALTEANTYAHLGRSTDRENRFLTFHLVHPSIPELLDGQSEVH